MTPALSGYVPLALQKGWVLERAFGWSVLAEDTELKVLARRRGPLRRLLLLSRGAPRERVDRAARDHGARGPLTRTTLVEFHPDAPAPATREIAGLRFTRADRARFFGAGTFVLDLREPEDALWARVSSGKRKEARHQERLGARATCRAADAQDARAFVALHAALARRKRLPGAPQRVLLALVARGALLACRALDAQGVTRALNLLYVGHDQGYFLHGASDAACPPGLGLLAQWEGVRALRARGLRFYDLGLVASTDEADGVFRFKRALGGHFVACGPEYRHAPAWMRLVGRRQV